MLEARVDEQVIVFLGRLLVYSLVEVAVAQTALVYFLLALHLGKVYVFLSLFVPGEQLPLGFGCLTGWFEILVSRASVILEKGIAAELSRLRFRFGGIFVARGHRHFYFN